jgi:Protein of unknown function (DUF2958)
MELLTPAHKEAFRTRFSLGSQEGQLEDALVVVKLFHPASRFTFYVTEGSEEPDGDWMLFGYTVSALGKDCDEWGYGSLLELQKVETLGLPMERDLDVPIGERTLKVLLRRNR